MDVAFKLKTENPKRRANLLSKLLFAWLVPIIKKGNKQTLEVVDLYEALDADKSKRLGDALEKHWDRQVLLAKEKSKKPSLMWALWKTFRLELIMYGILWCIQNVVLTSLKPLLIAQLVALFINYSDDVVTDIYIYSAAFIGVNVLIVFIYHHTAFGLQALGMKIRVAISSLVYRKITKLNQKALGQTAAGQIANLLSNDVMRFDLVVVPLHALWVMPIQVAVLLFIMWQQVGISSVAGVVAMAVVSLPVQGYLARLQGKFRERISKKTDKRVKVMSEVVSGIQVIKMYAWEKPFEAVIKLARGTEVKDITAASYLRGVYSSCMVFLDRMALFFTIVCYILLGNLITADIVFSLAQTFNILQMAMAIYWPWAVSQGAEALVSVKRVQEFLVMEEKEESKIDDLGKSGVILSKVNASWTPTTSTLQDISLQIPSGTLCAVVGPVGAGKSSLLQLLLGELPTKSGKVSIGGEISYSSQEPWLFQSSVRKNILFGKPYEKTWYDKVVKVCALERDFEQFPHKDRTIVGEKGVSLSGGQRARINLARAIYRNADVYLLDDPLSAVDTHVGKHLFENCIVNHLRGKTRILVTHQIQYLKKANLIVVVNDGKIEAQGTFNELMEYNLDFTKLLVAADETDDKEEDADSEGKLGKSGRASARSRRKSSAVSALSDFSESMYDDPEVIEEESGNTNIGTTFKQYILSTKSLCFVTFTTILLVIAQGINVLVDLWVTYWTSQEQIRHSNGTVISLQSADINEVELYPINQTTKIDATHRLVYNIENNGSQILKQISFDDIFDKIDLHGQIQKIIKTDYAIYIYSALMALAIILTIIRSFLFYKCCMLSSANLHKSIFHTLLKAPMRFFDTNPSGRILNRFSKDMGAIDEVLPKVLLDSCQIFVVMAGILVSITVSNYYILILLVPMGYIFLKFKDWYVATAKVLKHIEGITKSPVFSYVNSTLNGITTIRAANAQNILKDEFDENQDAHTSAWYLTIGCMSSFGLWLDIVSIIFMACVIGCFIILTKFTNVDGSLVGLAVSQGSVLIGLSQYGVRQLADFINQLTSVERTLQYTKIETEGPFETPKEKIPKGVWPKEGLLEFRNLSLIYVVNDPPVLNNLNFVIKPGQKVGIVGRTGAGKSSLIAALFRLAPTKGSIFVDGVDTKNLGLTDLRKKISIIPQEPVLFSATLRYNLDPFNEFDDEKIWKALEQVDLRESIDSLDFQVAEGGGNFSLGQRQLVCLARAVLKNNKILVLDEATANVDPRTDALIQATIRKRFKDCTVLTIAHRLNTIMDSDKVLVMSFGSMIEFDHPHNLLEIPDGHFHRMVLETGAGMTQQLKSIAKAAYNNKIE
ncbi:ATP binding cassette (ABC) transporter subfamily C member [Diabrotica virgifera virgifera]|uniref:Multidrug resistance-associated protein 4-like isoform X2 n=1 Tax=Diabrotica virgifera virgifera TaxID=50390 RepID=A0A6P7G906_DIAVI|nr:ATP binding cassette (ABC) transporter subfamily C member [Diabrotica virgifera virgifera]